MEVKDMEDKELLKIRIETLKTMIGRLKKEKEFQATVSCKQSMIEDLQNNPRKLSCPNLSTPHTHSRYKYRKQTTKINKPFPEEKFIMPQPSNSSNFVQNKSSDKFKWRKYSLDKPQRPYRILTKWSLQKPQQINSANTANKLIHTKVPVRTLTGAHGNIINTTDISKRKSSHQVDIRSKYKYVKKSEKTSCNKGSKDLWKPSHYTTQNINSTKYKFVKINSYKFQHHQGISYTNEDSFLRKRYNVVRKTFVPTNASVNKRWVLPKPKRRETFSSRRLKYVQRKFVRCPSSNSQEYARNISSKKRLPNSPNKNLILSRHGTHYKVAGNLRSLRRLSNDGNYLKRKPSLSSQLASRSKYIKRTVKPLSVKRKIASQVLKRVIATRPQCKKDNTTKFCLFYSRFGKCKRGKDCKYIHDPEKIAVCTRFLRGTCKGENCPFSHKIDPKKMPVCSYFLLGKCTTDQCPYRHVNVSDTAEVCQEFLKGYCPQEEKCTKKHILYCMEFSTSGTCSLGSKCRLIHRLKTKKRKRTSSLSGARRPKAFRNKKRDSGNSTFLKSREEGMSTLTDLPLRNDSPLRNNGHLLPKFISSKLNMMNSDTKVDVLPSSSCVMRNLFGTNTPSSTSAVVQPTTCDKGHFIPLDVSSSDDDDEGSCREHTSRRFSFKEQDFIAL